MKVKRLIELLSACDPESEVIIQEDPEGNGYSPLDVVDDEGVYVSDSLYGGQVYDTNWTAEEAGLPESDWAVLKREPRCVTLVPTN